MLTYTPTKLISCFFSSPCGTTQSLRSEFITPPSPPAPPLRFRPDARGTEKGKVCVQQRNPPTLISPLSRLGKHRRGLLPWIKSSRRNKWKQTCSREGACVLPEPWAWTYPARGKEEQLLTGRSPSAPPPSRPSPPPFAPPFPSFTPLLRPQSSFVPPNRARSSPDLTRLALEHGRSG